MTGKRPARRSRGSSQSRQTVVPVVPDRPPALNTARSKHACFGSRMKTTHHSDELKLIHICALVVRSVLARARTARFSMAVPGMLLKWCQLTTGKQCMESHFQTYLLLRPLPSFSVLRGASFNSFARCRRLLPNASGLCD